MATRKDAWITKYPAGGYSLIIPSGQGEYEADTVKEAMQYAYEEGVTRVYSTANPKAPYVVLARED